MFKYSAFEHKAMACNTSRYSVVLRLALRMYSYMINYLSLFKHESEYWLSAMNSKYIQIYGTNNSSYKTNKPIYVFHV